MRVVTLIDELRRIRAELPEPFGLVPTMGFLHAGHISLVRAAQEQCASVGVTIFVNPTQFGPQEDLEEYPRDLERDLNLLRSEGVDLVWTPTRDEMYPPDFQTWVTVEELTKPLEGAQRPGHFRGVTTVVAKLLNACQPDRAYFGQKDAQQARVIERMVLDLNFPTRTVICPTVREADGLAMSSRNTYLDEGERRAATALYRALSATAQAFHDGERRADQLRQTMRDILAAEPMARPEYVSVADPESLEELSGAVEEALLSMAVHIGEVRLIDNVIIERPDSAAEGA
jgi:pantoate--beta-alanine ligase